MPGVQVNAEASRPTDEYALMPRRLMDNAAAAFAILLTRYNTRVYRQARI
jgi:hypothetical protein